ncbi:hypothetical protein NLG97_g7365 [Lecanicillium saksenae]|uniref:Uncharacterized protein n=1 Tax=Lecanicillium saksenae TaxID=468837 RepID=A0ACC1QM19_9HYPO|nr:hypothetical protein NLG97_g7365 [Lecanicillium saksenae]
MAPARSVLAVALAALLGGVSQASYTEQPACPKPFTPFQCAGCVGSKDGKNPFDFRSSADQSTMTVAKCTSICKGNSYRYAALTYYGVCYCGNIEGGQQVHVNQCNYKCSGDSSESCGGANAFSVWEDPTFSKGVEEIATTDYESQGCYTDKTGAGRTLGHPFNVPGLTPDKCISACKGQGYAYAGVEYGGECWCDSNINPKATKAAPRLAAVASVSTFTTPRA